jgi:hypothetical protein
VCTVIFVSSIGSSFAHGEVVKAVMSIVGPVIVVAMYGIHQILTRSKLVTIAQIEARLLESGKELSQSGTSLSP